MSPLESHLDQEARFRLLEALEDAVLREIVEAVSRRILRVASVPGEFLGAELTVFGDGSSVAIQIGRLSLPPSEEVSP